MDYSLIFFYIAIIILAIIGGFFFIKINFCQHVWTLTDIITLYDTTEDGEKYTHGCILILQCKKCGNIKKLKI